MKLFWNPDQRRLRAGWRLVLQSILFFFLLTFVQLVTQFGAAAVLIASGQLDIDLSDSQGLGAQIAQAAMQNPLLSTLSILGVLFCTFLSIWIAGLILDRRPFADFGFHLGASWTVDFAFGLALGAGLMVLIFIIELAAGWIDIQGFFHASIPGAAFGLLFLVELVKFICVGFYEEMLSRGYHLRNIAEGMNFKPLNPRLALLIGYLFSSLVFSVFHLANPHASWISTINLVVAGLLLGAGFVLTGELAVPIGLHIAWNLFQGTIFGFPVSGTDNLVSLVWIEQSGPEWITGAGFGPEAGMIGMLAMLLGLGAIYAWVRRRRGLAHLQARLAVYSRS